MGIKVDIAIVYMIIVYMDVCQKCNFCETADCFGDFAIINCLVLLYCTTVEMD